jgi:hypothetical protein
MRPRSVTAFEWLNLGSIAIGLVEIFRRWDSLAPLVQRGGIAGLLLFGVTLLFSLGLVVVLTLLVSRRRSKVSMWVLFGFLVLGTLGLILRPSRLISFTEHDIVYLVQTVMQIAAMALLFTASGRRWISGARAQGELTETFS